MRARYRLVSVLNGLINSPSLAGSGEPHPVHMLPETDATTFTGVIKAYIDAGLKYLKLSDADLLAKIERDPKLLRLPLIRAPKGLSIGHDEAAWKAMLAPQP